MPNTISVPGLALCVFELQGSLKCTLTRNGKKPKVYEFDESDFDYESHTTSNSEDLGDHLKAGIDASGIGIRLRLFQNDGSLALEFEGKDGSTALWAFEGMESSNGGRLVTAATTQTDVDPKKCLMCGTTKRKTVEVKHEETQTDAPNVNSTGIQTTKETYSTSTAVQTRLSLIKHNAPSITSASLKRKAPSTSEAAPQAAPLIHKRAKSDVGNLHIDVKEAIVWFEGWFGKEHARMFESGISGYKRENGLGVNKSAHVLSISCLTAKLDRKRILVAGLATLGWGTWGSHEP